MSRLRTMSSPSSPANTLPSSPFEQATEIRALMNQHESPLVVDDQWYCVAMDWWSQWKEYTEYESTAGKGFTPTATATAPTTTTTTVTVTVLTLL